MLARAAAELAPHDVAFYLRDLAAAFHSYYAAERFLVDDARAGARAHGPAGRHARRCCATRCAVLGVSAPASAMAREAAAGRSWTGMNGRSARPAQRGGFVMGLIVGLLLGLALALAVALYVTKAPVPFVNKVPQRTPEQDAAEAERNRNWDPERAAGQQAGSARVGRPSPCRRSPRRHRAKPPAVAEPRRSRRATRRPSCPARSRRRSPSRRGRPNPGVDPFIYFVQAGAFSKPEDAEQQRAKLAMLGYAAKVTEREQSGRTMYRVRLGPYQGRDEAESTQAKLQSRWRNRRAGARGTLKRAARPLDPNATEHTKGKLQ